jgi:hypothetical protein
MIRRIAFASSSLCLSSLLVLAAGCSSDVTVPVPGSGGDGGGGDGGSSGSAGDGASSVFSRGDFDCPSTKLVGNICQPSPPQASADTDCAAGVREGVCLPVAPQAAPALDCAPTAPRDGLCDPAPPTFASWSCPAGSTAVPGLRDANGGSLAIEDVAAFSACIPVWPENCVAAGTMPKLGVNACTPISAACPTSPTDPWPLEDQIKANNPGFQGSVIYVNPTAAPGNTLCGTRVAPCASLAEAFSPTLANADNDSGNIVALAAGTYSIAPLTITGRTAVVGACSGTILRPTTGTEANPIVSLGGNGARIADLTLTGAAPGLGVASQVDGTTAERVEIRQTRASGVTVAANGRVTLTNVYINQTQAGTSAGGIGLNVTGAGAAVTLAGVALVSNSSASINLSGSGASLDASDLLVTDTTATGGGGQGLVVGPGANANLTRAAFARNLDAAISVQGAQSSAFLVDTYVTATAPGTASVAGGAAVYAAGGAQITAQRLMATANTLGLHAGGSATGLDLTDVVVADAATGDAANSGTALWTESGVTVKGNSLTLLRNNAGILTNGGTAQFNDLVIAGSTATGLSAVGTDVSLARGAFSDNGSGASFTQGASLQLSDLKIVDGKAQQGAAAAHALYVDASNGSVERLSLARNYQYGVFLSGPATKVDLIDLRISDTQAVSVGSKSALGIGFTVADPAGAPQVNVTRALIDQSHNYGLVVSAPAAAVTLQDVSVTNTQSVEAGRGGGILLLNPVDASAQTTASLDLTRVVVGSNYDSGITATGPNTELTMQDVSITDTGAATTPDVGAGLVAQGGASVTGQRVSVARSTHGGVGVDGATTSVDLSDLLVTDTTAADSSVVSGEGVKVVGGKAILNAASLLHNSGAAIWAAQGANLEAYDIVISDTQAAPAASGLGVGIDLIGATLKGERLSLARNTGLGISAALGSELTLTDLSITQTAADPAQSTGRGIEVVSGSVASFTHALLANNRDYAILAAGPDAAAQAMLSEFPRAAGQLPAVTTLTVDDASIHDTLAAVCASSSCSGNAGGVGIGALSGAALDLDTFDIRSNPLAGVQALGGATLAAARGELTANGVGVNVQGGGIDLTKSLTDVDISKNQTDQGTKDLPAPTPTDVAGRSTGRLAIPAVPSPF